mmetsp:Transcript_26001/g.41266  ORF Transcript_26001/g.41266 Transcript_26001/m.41266 type:complete len:323 (-) Transcript_26001:158-1126(-)
MPVFKEVKSVQSVQSKDFDPFGGVEAPKSVPPKGNTDEEIKKVQALTSKFVQAANGESSGICLAALDELRSAIRPTPQEEMVLGQSNLDTQRRLGNLLDAVGGPTKMEATTNEKDGANKNVQSEIAPTEPEPAPPSGDDVKQGQRSKFTVSVNKEPGTKLGITTCWADGESLVICSIVNGLVQEYNDKVGPNAKVEVGDRIVSINGEAAPLDSLKETMLKAVGEFKFEVQPHSKFTVTINRGSAEEKFGLDVANKPYDQTLLVKGVLPGLISNFNNASTGYKVTPGDRIVAINGTVGPGQVLRKMVNDTRGEINLSMTRKSN